MLIMYNIQEQMNWAKHIKIIKATVQIESKVGATSDFMIKVSSIVSDMKVVPKC